MKCKICMLTLLVFCISKEATAVFNTADARSQSLGMAGTMLTDHTTGFSNPAALALSEASSVVFQVNNTWCLPELMTGIFSWCMPMKGGTFVLSFSRYGFEAFHESEAAILFGKSLGSSMRAGIELKYKMIRQYGDYGNLHTLIPGIGFQADLLPGFVLGFHISNPASQEYYPHGYKKLPAEISTGVGYHPDPQILFCLEFSKEVNNKPIYCGGMEYVFEKQFAFRVGLSSAPGLQYSIGIGFSGDHLKTDLSVIHHPILGYSPAVTITCNL